MNKVSDSSAPHGLLARIIENWLTSINERQYQLPFCQVLAADNETILYVSSHGPFEKGKDVITRTSEGEFRAYQLKARDLGLTEWRAIYGEIANLVELAIEHPSIGLVTDFSPYLVTNGEVTDPVLEQVRVANLSWRERGINKTLRIIQKGELLGRFLVSHGSYLPRELRDFNTFLELILRDGTFIADKACAARLLEGVLPSPSSGDDVRPLDIGRAAASSVLLTAYITRAAQEAGNHWSVFEYWVTTAAYILRLAEEYELAKERWATSFELCERAAERALLALLEECKSLQNYVQGVPVTDGHVYASRITLLAGLFSSLAIRDRIVGREQPSSDFVLDFIQRNLRNSVMWGESAIPFYFMVALELDYRCKPKKSEGLVIQLIREIASQNSLESNGRGIPNIYYSPEAAVRLIAGLDFLNDETFVGLSYTLAGLIDFLARRWRRQALASLWYSITRISLATYRPASAGEWYRWKSTEGSLQTTLGSEPQSWTKLRDEAEALGYDGLPRTLIAHPQFAAWFMLVYPQRFNRQLAKLIEDYSS